MILLDAMGNHTREDVYDPASTLTRTQSRVYNSLNRLVQDIGGMNQTTGYAYDGNGNQTSVTDPLNHPSTSAFDALNRLIQVTDAGNGVTQYQHDALDRLTQVTDPRNQTTTYS